MRGVDYSWGRPTPSRLVELGFSFIMRYLIYPGHGGKGLTREEREAATAQGLAVGVVFEKTDSRTLDGFSAGVQDAREAEEGLAIAGLPRDQVVYFAVDFNAQPSHYPAVLDYFRGVVSVRPVLCVGAYGGLYVLEMLRTNGVASWFWQAGAASWSGYQRYPYAHIIQGAGATIDGHSVDYNETFGSEQGLYTEESAVTVKQYEDLVISCYSGKEEKDLPRAKRLENALYRMNEVVEGRSPSINDRAASAWVIATRVAVALGALGAVIQGLNIVT